MRLDLSPALERLYGGALHLDERLVYANFVATLDGVVAIPSLSQSNKLISGGSEADRWRGWGRRRSPARAG